MGGYRPAMLILARQYRQRQPFKGSEKWREGVVEKQLGRKLEGVVKGRIGSNFDVKVEGNQCWIKKSYIKKKFKESGIWNQNWLYQILFWDCPIQIMSSTYWLLLLHFPHSHIINQSLMSRSEVITHTQQLIDYIILILYPHQYTQAILKL